MVFPTENPITKALAELMDVAKSIHNTENSWLFALAWLAVCRLTPIDGFGRAPGLKDLLSEESGDYEIYSEIPSEAKKLVWGQQLDSPNEASARAHALSIITSLIEYNDHQFWDVIDAPWLLTGGGRPDFNGSFALSPELCDLSFELIRPEAGNSIWIPFDATGQLVLRAVRKGLRVIATGPGRRSDLHLRLLLAIEGANRLVPSDVQFDSGRDGNTRDVQADYLIATPPFNMKIQTGAGWRQWEGIDQEHFGPESLYKRIGPISQVQLDRSDSWAIAAFWPRTSKRAVFLVSPNVLFGKGQEQRLREYLLFGDRSLSAVTLLPTRQLGTSNIASAIVVMDRDHAVTTVKLTDATEMTTDTKSSMKYSRVLDLERVVGLMTGGLEDPKTSCVVDYETIAKQEYNLVPARYLRPALSGAGGHRRLLGELVTVIRAPVASKDSSAVTIQEVGIPELDRWREISGPFLKTTDISAKKVQDSMLRSGDVVLSIKGTLGKSALVGAVPNVDASFGLLPSRSLDVPVFPDLARAPAVTSQSCIALRVRDHAISAPFLFVYLRSDDFKSQIDSLRVGASVAHVTPATLCQEIWVPVPSVTEQETIVARYTELCELETSIDDAKQRIEDIRANLWASK